MPATIQDIYNQFDPLEPLGADDPRYVDCIEERGMPAPSPASLFRGGNSAYYLTTSLHVLRFTLNASR